MLRVCFFDIQNPMIIDLSGSGSSKLARNNNSKH
jgi:hypothetical protein